jgi:phenylacetic acid degradation operon negative regulatory protein
MRGFVGSAKKMGWSLLSECAEGVLYLLWISSLGVSQRLFTAYLGNQFTKRAAEAKLNRLYRKGYILKIKKGRNIFIKLKTIDQNIFLSDPEKLKHANYESKWDGVWRLLAYDVPEKEKVKRDALRRYLKELGFGKIQGSCWVSPYNLSSQLHEFCESEDILRYICLYEGKFFAGKSIDALVEETWGLNAINAEYKEFISLCKESAEKIKQKDANVRSCCDVYFKVYVMFARITGKDPFLPKDFLTGWMRDEALEVFDNFSRLCAGKLLKSV